MILGNLFQSGSSWCYQMFFLNIPLASARSIPFFWSTNVEPLIKLDITAIIIPATGNSMSDSNVIFPYPTATRYLLFKLLYIYTKTKSALRVGRFTWFPILTLTRLLRRKSYVQFNQWTVVITSDESHSSLTAVFGIMSTAGWAWSMHLHFIQ